MKPFWPHATDHWSQQITFHSWRPITRLVARTLLSVRPIIFLVFLPCSVPARCQSDTTPPILRDFSISPTVVDTSQTPVTIMLEGHLTDDCAGLPTAYESYSLPFLTINFQSKSGQRANAVFSPDLLVETNARDATFFATLSLPQFAEGGVWTLHTAQFSDDARNVATYTAADFDRLGFPFQFTNGSAGDTNAPQLLDVSAVKIDDGSTNQSFRVRVVVADDLSGCGTAGQPASASIYVSFISPSGKRAETRMLAERVLGDNLKGTYEAIFTLSRYDEGGLWLLYRITLMDNARNARVFTADDLKQLFPAANLLVEERTPDVSPPELLGLQIETPRVSTATNSQSVVIVLRTADDLSGMYSYQPANIALESPSKGQSAIGVVTRVDANTFKVQIDLPQHAEGGSWRIRTVYLYDNAGNYREISTDELVSRGFPSSIINDDPPPLRIANSVGLMTVSWPRQTARFNLETTTDLHTNGWRVVGNTQSTSSEETSTFSPGANYGFYRLRLVTE